MESRWQFMTPPVHGGAIHRQLMTPLGLWTDQVMTPPVRGGAGVAAGAPNHHDDKVDSDQ